MTECRVKATVVGRYEVPECAAYLSTTDGLGAEVILDVRNTGPNYIFAAEVYRKGQEVLIELPAETSAGYWRVTVNADQILEN